MKQSQLAIQTIANNDAIVCWTDRRLGLQRQNVSAEVGDFVLKRADGCFVYQLAVVVDDASVPWACQRRFTCTRLWCWVPMAKSFPNKMAQHQSTPPSHCVR